MKNLLLLLLGLFATAAALQAQTTLSVQGTVQNFDGSAVVNGEYDITFKLYETDAGGTPIWEETQTVNVNGGVYSVLLGDNTPLDAPFNTTYYLGITLPGGPELSPRARLTSSPYALSLVGQDNTFPSTGPVGVGTNEPESQQALHVVGSTKLEGDLEITGTVTGIDMDVDFTNIETDINTIQNISAEGTVTAGSGIELPADQTIEYNGLKAWRLVEVNDFEEDNDGWAIYQGRTSDVLANYELDRRNLNLPAQDGLVAINPSNQINRPIKKHFDLSGIPHTEIKVGFTIHLGGSSDNECVAVGIGEDLSEPPTRIKDFCAYLHHVQEFYEIVLETSDGFTLSFWSSLNENSSNEYYAIDNIEIWVR